MQFTRLMIGDIYLEKDINNEPRIILKDETGEEWVLGQESTGHGFRSIVGKKDASWFFNDKNRHKEITPFFDERLPDIG